MSLNVDELLEIAHGISNGTLHKYTHHECFTSGAFDQLHPGNVSSTEAFELMREVCRRYESVAAAQKGVSGYFYLLEILARLTDTTEMPHELPPLMDAHPEHSHGLKVWYRVSP